MPNSKHTGHISQQHRSADARNMGSVNLHDALELARAAADVGRTVVLVEGISDQLAFQSFTERRGYNLDAANVSIVAMGGVTNFGHFLELLGPRGFNAQPVGLLDIGEAQQLRGALERTGFGSGLTKSDIEALGFYFCRADLEDELIRALGVEGVLAVINAQRDLELFRKFQNQPTWRERSVAAQLRRWLGTTAQRKIRYAKFLVDALDLDRSPVPLDRLLARITHVD